MSEEKQDAPEQEHVERVGWVSINRELVEQNEKLFLSASLWRGTAYGLFIALWLIVAAHFLRDDF